MMSSIPAGQNISASGIDREHSGNRAEWDISIAGIIRVLRANLWLLITCTVLGLLLGIGAAIWPRHYTAKSSIRVTPGASNQFKLDKESLLSGDDSSTQIESEVEVLQSDTLFLQVAKQLNLQNEPLLLGKSDSPRSLDDPETQEKLLKVLHKDIKVERVPRTQIIDIECRTKSAELSVKISNTLINDYLERMFQTSFNSTQHVAQWLSGQLGDIKSQVDQDQEKLIVLQKKLGIIGFDPSHNIVAETLSNFTKAESEAKVQRIIAEAKYRALSSDSPNLIEGGQTLLAPTDSPGAAQASLLSTLRARRAQAEAAYNALSANFGKNYPDVKSAKAELDLLNAEVAKEQTRVLHQAAQAYTAAVSNEKATTESLEQQKDNAFKQGDAMVQLAILEEQYEASRSLYEGLVVKLREAGIVAGLLSSEVDIVDLARIPGKPDDLPRPAVIILGLIGGFVVGATASLLFHQFDTRLRDLSAIEADLHLATLAIVPKVSETLGGISFIREPKSHFAEAMLILRTSLLLSTAGNPPKVILFTSSRSGEGKSTVASNEACALAARGARVLLIDGDMRRPSVHYKMQLSNRVGLSSVLTGEVALQDAIQEIPDLHNLFVLTSGPTPPSPASLLDSSAMNELMAKCSSQFDFICIDSPPVLGMTDSVILGRLSHATVVVLHYDMLNARMIRRAQEILTRAGSTITGVVVNFTKSEMFEYYGYSKEYYG